MKGQELIQWLIFWPLLLPDTLSFITPEGHLPTRQYCQLGTTSDPSHFFLLLSRNEFTANSEMYMTKLA